MTPRDVSRPSLEEARSYTALTHLYRGEMHRMTVWRQRLDVTSNWAIILATGLTTFTLGDEHVPHYTLLLGLALIGISIVIEGRRYRHLHHSKWRLYLLEFGFFAEQLQPHNGRPNLPDWRQILAADLRHAHFLIDWFTAVRVRLRRNYLLLFYFMFGVWIAKLYLHPSKPHSIVTLYSRLAVGELLPPWFVAITAALFVVAATALALTCPSAEKLEDWSAHYVHTRKRVASGVPGSSPAPLP
jgi:uncharacterized membrane protein